MASSNTSWSLESFIDSLVVELDKTRETLAVKSLNKPLTYTVKDMALDLQIFPSYDGDQVKFVTAKPGEEGASRISIKLDSITDQVVRATTKSPQQKDDVSIENIEVDEDTKKSLRKIGVTSAKDLEELEKRDVDIGKVSKKKIDFGKLNNLIRKKKRDEVPPVIHRVTMSRSASTDKPVLALEGRNLAINKMFRPIVTVGNAPARILSFDEHRIEVELPDNPITGGPLPVIVVPDEYSYFKLNLR